MIGGKRQSAPLFSTIAGCFFLCVCVCVCQLSCSHPEAQTQPLAPSEKVNSLPPVRLTVFSQMCSFPLGDIDACVPVVRDQLVELRCCC